MGAIKVGTTDISAVYVGTSAVSNIYVGTTQVWPTAVATFSVSPSSLSFGNSSGTATLTFSYGVTDYSFTSSPGWCTVTTITSSGKVTGLSVAYTANSDNSTRSGSIKFVADGASREVSVSQAASSVVAVTGVSLSQSSISLFTGSTQQLSATITPSNATNQNVTWTSTDTSVATVSSSGLVTAVSTGTAVIRVTTSDGNYTDSCTATVATAALSVNTNSLSWTASEYDYLDYKELRITSNVSWTMTLTGSNFTTNQGTSYSSSENKVIYVYPTSQNSTTSERTAQISISATGLTTQYVSLTQAAVVATLSVNPQNLTFEYNEYGSSYQKSFDVTSNQSWSASIPSSAPFVFGNGSRNTSGTSNATVYVRPTTRNTETTSRSGTATLTAGSLSASVGLVQYSQSYSLSVTPTTLDTFAYSANSVSSGKTVTVTADHSWSASITSGFYINSSGTTTASGSSGTTYLTIFPSSTNSTTSAKTGTLTVTGSGSGFVRQVALTQDYNHALDVELIDSLSFVGTGETKYITATSGTISSWQITSAPSWCSYTQSGTSSSIPITASANNTGDARMYDLVLTVNGIEGYIVALDQPDASAVNYTFTVVPSPSDATVKLTVNGSTTTGTSVSCTAGTTVHWEVSKTNYVTQSGTYTMTAQNHTENVTLVYDYYIKVKASLSDTATSSITLPTFAYDADSYNEGATFFIDASQSWTLTKPSWCTIYGDVSSGSSGTTPIRVYPTNPNTGSSAKTGTITITGTHGETATVSLTQNYNTAALQSITVKCGTGTGDTDEVAMNDSCAFYEVYTPSGTTDTGVTWSIVSMTTPGSCTGQMIDYGGDSYFTVTINGSASIGDTITVRATSTAVSGKYGEKTVTVTSDAGVIEDLPESVDIDDSDFTYNAGSWVYMGSSYQMKAAVYPVTASQDVTWSLRKTNGSAWTNTSSVSITSGGLLTINSNSWVQVRVVATSVEDSSITDYINMLLNHG